MFARWIPMVGVQGVVPAQPISPLRTAKWLDPQLGELVAAIKPRAGSPRAEMTVPVAPGDALADTVVYEAPGDPAERFYLPRYALATHETDQGTQFRLRLTRQDPGTRISLVVQPSMPPEVQASAPEAQPLTHEVTGVLTFELPGGAAMSREWVFTDRAQLPDGIELSLVVPTLVDRDELYGALTSAAATFVVRRTITVAIPTGTGPVRGGRARFLEPVAIVPAAWGRRVVEPLAVDPAVFRLRRPAPMVPVVPGGVAAATVRRRPDRLGGGLRGRPVEPGPVDETPPAPPQVLYRATTRSVDQVLSPTPFTFSSDLHPYVYGDITGSGRQGGLVLEQVEFGGRHHSYYFAAGRPEVVYYLPDAFTLARVPEAPHPPMMSVAFETPDGRLADTSVTVVFAASAVASPSRLLDAARQLAAKGHLDASAMDLQPFLADSSRTTLRVSLPGSAGSSTVLADARIDLRTALSAGFRVPLAAFQSMFDRIGGADPRLFDGEVEVRLDRPDRPAEKVPLVVNLANLAGPLVDIRPVRQPQEPRYQVTITNAIESTVQLDTLAASLPQSAGPLPCELQTLSGTTTLARGESLTSAVVPATTPTEPDVLPEVVVVSATVTPDAAALWDEICEDTTSHFTTEVTVKASDQIFAPAADGNTILAVIVELGGLAGGLTDTVELTAATPVGTGVASAPIADLVLRAADPGQYRYRVLTVRESGETTGEWRTRTAGTLWIVTAEVT